MFCVSERACLGVVGTMDAHRTADLNREHNMPEISSRRVRQNTQRRNSNYRCENEINSINAGSGSTYSERSLDFLLMMRLFLSEAIPDVSGCAEDQSGLIMHTL